MEDDKQGANEEIKELETKLQVLKTKSQNNGDTQSSYTVPAAVIVAGILIAGAIFYSNGSPSITKTAGNNNPAPTTQEPTPESGSIDNIKPVTSEDHIKGNPNAPIKIIEFSDFECPFCKRFHLTMQQVMDEYGKDGKVAWVLRQFPLDSLHPIKAKNEATASECAAELGGNDKFWKYADKIFELTPSNNRLDQTLLPKIAEDLGLNRQKFEACLTSGKYNSHIEDDIQNAIASGARGTPFSVLVAPNGQKYPISGAQPYSAVKSIIDIALKSK